VRIVAVSAGLPSLSWKNQSGVWLCQTRVCPTTNMPCLPPNSTKASARSKSHLPGSGCSTSAFIEFSRVMALKCRTASACCAASSPLTMASLTAVPSRKSSR
jgi:hypothetical protein